MLLILMCRLAVVSVHLLVDDLSTLKVHREWHACMPGEPLSASKIKARVEAKVSFHPDNYTEADPYGTPADIVPERYFLPFYAILRIIALFHIGELYVPRQCGSVATWVTPDENGR